MQHRVTVFTRAASWIGLPRLYRSLSENGFAIDLICPQDGFALHSDFVDGLTVLPPDAPDQTWIDALLSSDGEKLLLGDDEAVDWLLLHSQRNSDLGRYLESKLAGLPALATARMKYRLAEWGAKQGIPVPAYSALRSLPDTAELVSRFRWPLVLKSSFGFAGQGVFVCRTLRDIRRARRVLQVDHNAFVQQYVAGTPLMIPMSCDKGRVLGRFTAVKRAIWPAETGPSIVVEITRHATAENYAEKLVASLGLSGLISFDFLLDAEGRYWLMECNLRPVPISHYRGLLASSWLHDTATHLPDGTHELLALYPQSLITPVDPLLFGRATLDDDLGDDKLSIAYKDIIAAARSNPGQTL